MTFTSRFRDFLWVLVAYFRGKVLRHKAYRPNGNVFHCFPGATCRRMITLIRWWGYRPVTVEELTASMNQRAIGGRVPYINWTDNKLSLSRSWDEWDFKYRFNTVRK